MSNMQQGRARVAVVAGLRTPFTKAGTALRALRTVDLASVVVKELVQRSEINPKEITLCIYGQVVPTLDAWVKDVSASRLYGGVHYRFSNEAGEEIGRKAARTVLEKVARPLAKQAKR